MKGFRVSGAGRLAAIAALSTVLTAGCGGGNESTDVKFPDVSKLPQPKEVVVGKGGAAGGVESKGDPGLSSQAK